MFDTYLYSYILPDKTEGVYKSESINIECVSTVQFPGVVGDIQQSDGLRVGVVMQSSDVSAGTVFHDLGNGWAPDGVVGSPCTTKLQL